MHALANDRTPELDALAAAAGLTDISVLRSLHAIGVQADSVAALTLAPLVEVAWADGTIAKSEREAIQEAARTDGLPPPALALLDRWLEAPPDPRLLSAWEAYLKVVAGSAGEAPGAIRDRLRVQALRVARAAGGLFGVGKISGRESFVLARIERAFYRLTLPARA